MDVIKKGTTWKNKNTQSKIKVLDSGVWVFHLDDKSKKTYSIEEFLDLFQLDSNAE